ncbi:endo-1 4-beta-xylanase [Phtheirospermum japonicum]|uniref:Endo-1 4-beta-xylanase n=1 Tax=Phtheirospermum japonicum TaxID=374723 RepID=A0A830CTX6_9LAMI|nr:endo-1 4-beta-xylanase [Phtheirospermum japonicum]
MTKLKNSNHILFNVIQYIVFGFQAYAVPYDYSYTLDCLTTPPRAQYDGGIVVNPELNEGLNGWTAFEDAKIAHAASEDGNKFIVASNRNRPFHSAAQTFDLESERLYTFSAWLQVSHGKADVAAIFKTKTSYETAGWVTAQKDCWSMLKGGLVVKTSGPAQLYFETNNTDVDICADSISLQSFTHQEWKSHQQQRIEEVRKTKVRFHVVDKYKRPLPNATVSLSQTRRRFPLGCAINRNILYNPAYQSWFLSRFKYTVFENELKWYSTEYIRGFEDYSTSDAMVRFARSNRVGIRGHNIFWDDPRAQPSWVGALPPNELWAAAYKRINSVTNRYKGDLIHWDVVNENLHNHFFEDKLGNGAVSTLFYQMARRIDGKATPFLNDYNTIEYSGDWASSPNRYLQRIWEMRAQGYKGCLGIGLEGHFTFLNLPSVRAALDILVQARLPIWVTELDFSPGPNQAWNLNQILQELHSHEAVRGIMMWSAWSPQGCYVMCLTDNNFNNLATGYVVDNFINQLKHADDSPDRSTDFNGYYETSLYHGEYQVQAKHPNGRQFSNIGRISVLPKEGRRRVYRLTIDDEIEF